MNKEDLLFRNHLSFYTNQKMIAVYKNDEHFKQIYKILSSNHMQEAFEKLHAVINLPNGMNFSIIPKRINITPRILYQTKEKATIDTKKIETFELYQGYHQLLNKQELTEFLKDEEHWGVHQIYQPETDLLKYLEEKSTIPIVKNPESLEKYNYYYNYFYNNNTDNKKAEQFLKSDFIKKSKENIDLVYHDIIQQDKSLPCCIDFIEKHYKNKHKGNDLTFLEYIFIFNSHNIYNQLLDTDFLKQELEQAPFIKKITQQNQQGFFNGKLINIFEKDLLKIKSSNHHKPTIRRKKL